jgi:hypothetical protein
VGEEVVEVWLFSSTTKIKTKEDEERNKMVKTRGESTSSDFYKSFRTLSLLSL